MTTVVKIMNVYASKLSNLQNASYRKMLNKPNKWLNLKKKHLNRSKKHHNGLDELINNVRERLIVKENNYKGIA